MDSAKDEYLTKDLSEAAALLVCDTKLIRLDKEMDFYWFVFGDQSLCERISNSFWTGELKVSAKAYSGALKELKERLFSRR